MKARILILLCLLVFPGCLYSRVSALEDRTKTSKLDVKDLVKELEELKMRVSDLEEDRDRQAGLIKRHELDIDFLWKSIGGKSRGPKQEGSMGFLRHHKKTKKWLNALPKEKKVSAEKLETVTKLIANFQLKLEKEKEKVIKLIQNELAKSDKNFEFKTLVKRKAELFKAIFEKEHKQFKSALDALLGKEKSDALDALLNEY